MYLSERWFCGGSFMGYRVPLPSRRYRGTLQFAEIFFGFPGRRVFEACIEGKAVKTHLDLVDAVGFARPYTLPWEGEVTDGLLEITFLPRSESPKIAALEIEMVSKWMCRVLLPLALSLRV